MSAEVPKLDQRFPLEDWGALGDRPPAEVVVKIADPVVLSPRASASTKLGEPAFDNRSMAFPAWHRFEYV